MDYPYLFVGLILALLLVQTWLPPLRRKVWIPTRLALAFTTASILAVVPANTPKGLTFIVCLSVGLIALVILLPLNLRQFKKA
jgi:hypothetical protein